MSHASVILPESIKDLSKIVQAQKIGRENEKELPFLRFMFLKGKNPSHTHTYAPSTGSLYKWTQQPGLDQDEPGPVNCVCISHASDKDLKNWSHYLLLPWCISRELSWKSNSQDLNQNSRKGCEYPKWLLSPPYHNTPPIGKVPFRCIVYNFLTSQKMIWKRS